MVFASVVMASISVWCGYVQTRKVQEGIPFRLKFVSANGWYRRLIGVRECNGCVKLLKSDQLMLPTGERRNMAEEAAKTAAFSEFCRTNGIPFLFVQVPKKLDAGKTMLPPDVKDFAYENADDLLRRLGDAGVAIEDWRPRFAGSAEQVAANFYEADTHWNNPTSLQAARELVRALGRLRVADSLSVARAEKLLSPAAWDQKLAKRYFFGGIAKRTGLHFSDVSDVTFLLPKFETQLTLKLPDQMREASGAFDEVAVPAYRRFKVGKRRLSFSAQYAGGDDRFVRLINTRAPLGNKKVLLIGDSFSRSVRTYLWVAVREVVAVDLRQYSPPLNVARLVLDERPDIVIQMPTAASLTVDVRTGEKRGHPAVFDYGL